MDYKISQLNSYPKSKHGFRCLGPCYYAKTDIVHPVTLTYVTDKLNNFCPVNAWEQIDQDTGRKLSLITDVCSHPSESKDLSGKEFEISILTPNIDFNALQFLKIYYSIYSFEDAVEYINSKKYLPLLTRLRIMDCALTSYGKEVNIIDHRVVDFFIVVVTSLWLEDLTRRVDKYLKVDGGKISFSKNDERDSSVPLETKMNFIRSKFVTNDELFKFLMRYIKHRKNDWEKIPKHIESIRDNFFDYVENKINVTLA